MNKQRDFLVVMASYLVTAITIAAILPYNTKGAFGSLVLAGMAYVLDWYWNRHLKA